jgi:hypothetical protein
VERWNAAFAVRSTGHASAREADTIHAAGSAPTESAQPIAGSGMQRVSDSLSRTGVRCFREKFQRTRRRCSRCFCRIECLLTKHSEVGWFRTAVRSTLPCFQARVSDGAGGAQPVHCNSGKRSSNTRSVDRQIWWRLTSGMLLSPYLSTEEHALPKSTFEQGPNFTQGMA